MKPHWTCTGCSTCSPCSWNRMTAPWKNTSVLSAVSSATWAGLCPGNHESAGKRKTGKTRKGNHAIRYLLCEAANAARRTNSALRGKYQSLVVRKGHKKALIALAHHMIRTIFILFTRRQAYRDPGIDYQALVVKKNAPRWIQALKKYGYWPRPGTTARAPAPASAH